VTLLSGLEYLVDGRRLMAGARAARAV